MPHVALFTHYVLRKGCVKSLKYRNGAVLLETVPFPKTGSYLDFWVFRTRRVDDGHYDTCIIHECSQGRYYLETVLFNEGFLLENGCTAARVMDRLVREGRAFSRAPSRRDFKGRR